MNTSDVTEKSTNYIEIRNCRPFDKILTSLWQTYTIHFTTRRCRLDGIWLSKVDLSYTLMSYTYSTPASNIFKLDWIVYGWLMPYLLKLLRTSVESRMVDVAVSATNLYIRIPSQYCKMTFSGKGYSGAYVLKLYYYSWECVWNND